MSKRIVGPFEIDGRLGVGGMGIVYRATLRKSGQPVALKILSPAFSGESKLVARFEREIAILKKLKHPNIVHYFGGGRIGSQRFYAMELLEAGSLESLLKEKGRLSWEQTIEFGMQICKALEHAHAAGIIHRDIKPANLFLGDDGTVKLGDFGIARDTDATALTAAGRTVGTYAYMAPEQIRGKPPLSAKSDLYALGCVLYELLTGEPPFKATSAPEMFIKHMQEEPARVTEKAIDCPVWLDAAVMQLMEKDVENRPYDALAVQVLLQDVGDKVGAQASVSQQVGATAVNTHTVAVKQADHPELRRILGRKKKRKRRKNVPLYERTWVLVTALVVLIAGLYWATRPMSEEKMFARAEALMESEEPGQWMQARRSYLLPLLELYPDGVHAQAAQQFLDKIEMWEANERAEKVVSNILKPKSEAERIYADGRRFESFGDRISALEQYQGLLELHEDDPEATAYRNLARERIAELEASASEDTDDEDSPLNIIVRKLDEAEALLEEGHRFRARRIWNYIVALYGKNQEYATQVEKARERLLETSTANSGSDED